MNGSSFEADTWIILVLLCLLQDRNWKAKFNKLVDVRRSSMLERLRRICCKSPHVSAMLFQHMIFPSIERNWSIMHVDPRSMKQLLSIFCF